MTHDEAIAILVDIASRWGENAEEDFSERINPNDTDADLERKITHTAGPYDFDTAKEIRALWQAISVVKKESE